MDNKIHSHLNFSGVCMINSDGEISCFCSKKEVETGKCSCAGEVGSFQMEMDLKLLKPLTKPYKKNIEDKLQQEVVRMQRTASNLKQGLAKLESSINKHTRLF